MCANERKIISACEKYAHHDSWHKIKLFSLCFSPSSAPSPLSGTSHCYFTIFLVWFFFCYALLSMECHMSRAYAWHLGSNVLQTVNEKEPPATVLVYQASLRLQSTVRNYALAPKTGKSDCSLFHLTCVRVDFGSFQTYPLKYNFIRWVFFTF